MLIEIILPLNTLRTQNRPHDIINLPNELVPDLLRIKLAGRVIHMEENGIRGIFTPAVEIALAGFVEENINPEGGDTVTYVEVCYFLCDGCLFLLGEGFGG